MAELEHRPSPLAPLRDWWDQEIRRHAGGGPVARIAQLHRRRAVLRMLVIRDLKKQYENSYLGYAWALLQPLMLIGIYWLIWGRIGRFHVDHFVLFLATAMMPWLWFRGAVQGASGTIAGNSRLVSSINLPREIYPVALVLVEGVEYLMTLPLVFVIAAFDGVEPTAYILLLPFAALLELIFVTGMTLFMSAVTTLFTDINRVLGVALRIWFYLTPVIYPTGRLHGKIHVLFVLDPLVGIFELNRKVFFPATQISSFMMTVSIVGSVLMLVVGWLVFIRLERSMLKEL